MKLALVFLAVVSAAFAAPSISKGETRGNLRPALDQLLENFDRDGFLALLPTLVESEEGQAVLEYLRGDKFDAILDALYAEAEFNNILKFLADNGLPGIYDAINALHELIGIPPRSKAVAAPKDLSEIIDQLLALVDSDGLLEDVLELVSSDVAVQELLAYLSRPEVAAAYQRIKVHPEVKALADRLRELGFDVDTIVALIEAVLGWGRSASVAPRADNLRPALDQLLENVDIEGLLALLPTLVESEEGQAVLEYLRGDKFDAILDALYAEAEFNNILKYLADNGLPGIYEAINALHELIGIPPRSKAVARHVAPKDLQDLIDAVLALVDINGALEDVLELLGSDVAVQNLLGYLSRPEVAAAYQRIKAHPEVKALADRLRELGFDVDTIVALIESILGWGRSASIAPKADNLRPALDQLLENVNVEGLLALLPQLVESEEGQAVLEYLRGDKFDAILDALYAEAEFNNILKYLADNGLPGIYEAINALHELIGIPPRSKVAARHVAPKDLQDLIDAVLANINVNGLLEDVLELLGSDVAVQNLLGYLSRAEVAAAYQRIKAHPEVKALADRLRELGFDVDTIVALIESILGWGRSASPLADNLRPALDQLLENVNVEGLLALLPQLVESEEGQAVLEYLRGDKFDAILDALYAEAEFNNILKYLADNGLPGIYDAINALHELIGIPPRSKAVARQVTPKDLQDLIDLVAAQIDINGLLEDVLELLGSDVAVQNLLGYLSRAEVAAAYQRIKAHPEVKALADRLRELGFDVDTIVALIESILGWGFRFLH